MSIKDRTGEYWSIVHSFSSSQAVQPLRGDQQLTRSEFMLKASEIGKEVFSVGSKLEKLAKCKNFMNSVAKSKSIFDDKPAEIEELTFVIKKDIANLNQQIAELQHAKGKPKGKQSEEHNANVLVSLQSKLAYTSNTFKNVLEVRTQNMKIQKDRRDQFSSQLATSVITNPIPKPVEYPVQTYQQLELIEKQNTYLESRHTAIESIESTIGELGQIFQQLAHMVAEQGETIQRIDMNIEEVSSNVESAQNQLLRYWQSVSSNRWLMIKIFSILIVFILVFSIFFA